jgi:hypothetical protein
MPPISKTGYIQSYRLEANIHVDAHPEFFSVTVADDIAGQNPEIFILERIIGSNVDRNVDGSDVYAVSFGNVEQAMIATIKHALLHQKRVRIDGFSGLAYWSATAMVNRLNSIEIFRQ